MDLPKEFFTIQSMLTLTGATGATFVIANGCQRAFNFNPRWFALVIAQVISLVGVLTIGKGAGDNLCGYCQRLFNLLHQHDEEGSSQKISRK